MKFYLDHEWFIDTAKGIDLSIGISPNGVQAWYLNAPIFSPVMENGFVGSVEGGGPVNFRNVSFNPHGHGTHTESHGHISKELFPVSRCFESFFFEAELISLTPENQGDDLVIIPKDLHNIKPCEALVIRTLPNGKDKYNINYSNTNPPYMDVACVKILNDLGVKHLLIDLPSVDKEADGGVLAFHHAYWNVPLQADESRTITELIYVPNHAADGRYVLELQVANFENDAAPSRPILYKKERKL